MNNQHEIHEHDLHTLRGIVRGPGNYATPSPDKIERLINQGLVKKTSSRLAPTLKGRIVAWLSKYL